MKTIKEFLILTLMLLTAIVSNAQHSKHKIIDKANFDTSVSPKDDFYNYVNGGWMKNNQIPDDKTSWGNMQILHKKAEADIKAILKEAIANNNINRESAQGKAITFYETLIDTVSRNKVGVEPLKKYFKEIEKIKNKKDLENYLTKMVTKGGGGFLSAVVFTDMGNSNMNAVYVGTSPLGLPDRDFYLDTTMSAKKIRKDYKEYLSKMTKILSNNSSMSLKNVDAIINMETRLAKATLSRQESRNPQKIYNPMTIKQLSEKAPFFKWKMFFKEIGLDENEKVIITDVNYIIRLKDIFEDKSPKEWKAYLKWIIYNSYSSYLTTEISQANWEFFSKKLGGAKKRKSFEDRNISTINSLMGMALGKLYVDKKFSPEAKAKAKEIVQNIIEVYKNRIDNLDWMSSETKTKAKEKLANYKLKIGYPDKWTDYSDLKLVSKKDGGKYIDNIEATTEWILKKMFDKIGKSVDKTEWLMSPQTVNAYYNKVNNEIVFPAAILQAPYFDINADDAVNYGAFGAVVGHEITHGFDDTGAKFDKNGNFNNWWTEDDYKKFSAAGERLAKQYNQIEVLPSLNVNGKLTLGENIADIGGVEASYEALKKELKKKGISKKIDGFTPEERFFLSWSTVWRKKTRDERAKMLLKVDTHSPGQIRGYVPLQNIDAFYDVFKIKKGDKMYKKPEDRISIW